MCGGKTRWLIFILTKQIKYNKNKNGSNLVKRHKKSYLVEIQQVQRLIANESSILYLGRTYKKWEKEFINLIGPFNNSKLNLSYESNAIKSGIFLNAQIQRN